MATTRSHWSREGALCCAHLGAGSPQLDGSVLCRDPGLHHAPGFVGDADRGLGALAGIDTHAKEEAHA